MQFDIWSVLLAIGAFQGFLMFSYIISRPNGKKSKYFLSALILIIVLNLVDYLILASKAYRVYPQLITFSNATIFLIGPLYYFYMRSLIVKQYRLKWLDLVNLIPFIIAVFYHMDVYLLSVDKKIRFVEHYLLVDHYSTSFGVIAYITFHTLQSLFYGIWVQRLLKNSSSALLKKVNYGVISYWLLQYLLLIVLASLNRLTFEDDYLIVLNNAVLLNILIYLSLGDRKALKQLLTGDQKYQRSVIADEQMQHYQIQLDQLMDLEKPYLNPELKLNQLADLLGISSNHLSQVLNDRIRMSFNDYLNLKRIELVKEKLSSLENTHLNLYGIALDCGFNSKNTFNRAFKKVTGITPSEFRKADSLNQ